MMKFIFLIFFSFASMGVLAGNTVINSPVKIEEFYFFSEVDAINPEWQGVVQIIVNPVIWSSDANCNATSIAIRAADKHIISLILTAKTTDTPIKVYADDRATVQGTNTCFARAVHM